jgi:hypothetical protein
MNTSSNLICRPLGGGGGYSIEKEDGALRSIVARITDGYICPEHGTAKGFAELFVSAPETKAQRDALLEIVTKLIRFCPSSEGLGGHAPIGAFMELGQEARAMVVSWKTTQ